MGDPVRLRLSRQRGFRLQEESMHLNGLPAVNVARPSDFGNPFTASGARDVGFTGSDAEIAQMIVGMFRNSMTRCLPATERGRNRLSELRGKNLACFCKLDAPCHADVLLELAMRDMA